MIANPVCGQRGGQLGLGAPTLPLEQWQKQVVEWLTLKLEGVVAHLDSSHI